MSASNVNSTNRPRGKNRTAHVTVMHVGPQDQDFSALSDILNQTDWKMCPGTQWSLAGSEELSSPAAHLNNPAVPIVLCERDSTEGSWKDVLDRLGTFPVPPLLIVASRTADEYLWAEALNLGAYDVLSKPYRPTEVVRVLSMAWLHWMNRRTPSRTPKGRLLQAS